MAIEKETNRKKFYQNSPKPVNYVPNVLVTSAPAYPPLMSGLMQINPDTKDIWISAGRELVSDWINITSGGGGGGAVAVQFNGTTVSPAASTLNFVGTNIKLVEGNPLVTITIPQVPFIIKNTDIGATVNNTLTVGQTYSVTIPANTVQPGSIVKITYRAVKEALLNDGPTQISIRTGSSFATSTAIAYADITWSIATPNRYGQIKREFVVGSDGKTKYISNKASFFHDDIDALSEELSIIDWTVSQTLYFGIQHQTSVTDSAVGSFYCIEIY